MRIKQYSFMKRDSTPYPIRDLRDEVDSNMQIDIFEIGGCGCFIDSFAELEEVNVCLHPVLNI
jgi:hypothetical protein